ncbi:glycosyltransferase family 2 protein [Salinimicrobium sp. MT39]|uniref:Glycosyltransferase family 2 protein n=1 Tax=Salinimicrobium profundisediminis TaxID=2994553 RepID=A0A9X3CW64_9FLAO|nr:glycosyltransferase family 2 protein [Salinimicrobium profundisediminis]MCX2837901.1 glycosyltransferase family 2 protein [Salinimicrobium profundisediminis]
MNFEAFKNKYQKTEVEHFPHQVPSNPTVSVLVQAYNHEAFIEQCLESILVQNTDFDYEILLGEDYSTDRTREICLEYATKHPEKIRLFLHHPDNKIKVLNTTTGNFNAFYNLFSARGKYIAFCEGDDYWNDPAKLQKQVNFLNSNPSYVLAYHGFKEEFEEGGNRKPLEQPLIDLSSNELAKLIYHPLLSTTCFKNFGKELPEEIFEVLNVDSFILSLLGNYGEAKYLNVVKLSSYRRHLSGAWSSKSGDLRLLQKLNTLKKIQLYYRNLNKSKLAFHFKRQSQLYYKALSRHYFLKADYRNFLKYIFKAI